MKINMNGIIENINTYYKYQTGYHWCKQKTCDVYEDINSSEQLKIMTSSNYVFKIF